MKISYLRPFLPQFKTYSHVTHLRYHRKEINGWPQCFLFQQEDKAQIPSESSEKEILPARNR